MCRATSFESVVPIVSKKRGSAVLECGRRRG